MGNTDHEPQTNAQSAGALRELRQAFGVHPVRDALPPGSLITVVGYAENVEVRLPLGPAVAFDDAVLGDQRDHRNRYGSELVAGLERAIGELATTDLAMRRVIVVIGDGNDTNPAPARLRTIREELARHGIEVHAIVLPSWVSPDSHHLHGLTLHIQQIGQPAELDAALAHVWRELARVPPRRAAAPSGSASGEPSYHGSGRP